MAGDQATWQGGSRGPCAKSPLPTVSLHARLRLVFAHLEWAFPLGNWHRFLKSDWKSPLKEQGAGSGRLLIRVAQTASSQPPDWHHPLQPALLGWEVGAPLTTQCFVLLRKCPGRNGEMCHIVAGPVRCSCFFCGGFLLWAPSPLQGWAKLGQQQATAGTGPVRTVQLLGWVVAQLLKCMHVGFFCVLRFKLIAIS